MSWNSTLELLQSIKQFSDSNNIVGVSSKEKSTKTSEETAYKVISVIDNDLAKLHKDLWVSIEDLNWQEYLYIEWWAKWYSYGFEGVFYSFIADMPESNWKWNTQIVNILDLNKKWLLITSNQNYSCDRYQNIDKLKKELAWTESYFLFIEDYQWNKRIIQLWESLAPLKIIYNPELAKKEIEEKKEKNITELPAIKMMLLVKNINELHKKASEKLHSESDELDYYLDIKNCKKVFIDLAKAENIEFKDYSRYVHFIR